MNIQPLPSQPNTQVGLPKRSTRLYGRARILARAAWLCLVAFDLALFGLALPSTYAIALEQGLTFESSGLTHLGLSAGFYAAFHTGLALGGVLLSLAAGGFLFWIRSDDWMVWLVSLVLIGVAPGMEAVLGNLALNQPAWQPLVALQFSLGLGSTLLLVLTFPTGRFVPRGARAAFYLVMLLIAANAIARVATRTLAEPQLEWIVIYSLGFVAQLYRYRRSTDPIQRQQFKWIVLGFLVYAPTFTIYSLLRTFVVPSQVSATRVLFALAGEPLLFYIPALLLYLTAIFATLRYRLWDIDLLIRRTLIYSVVTLLLALFFNLSEIVVQQLIGNLTGQSSEIAVIVSTLAVAALFNPLSVRVRTIIDRRFYRQKYDAARVLAAFGATIRDEVDLSKMTDELMAVVHEAMQPAYLSLWLCEDGAWREHLTLTAAQPPVRESAGN